MSVEPLPHGGGKPPLIDSYQLHLISKLVEAAKDATLQELCHRLGAKTGIRVSLPTMCRLLQKLSLTRKSGATPPQKPELGNAHQEKTPESR